MWMFQIIISECLTRDLNFGTIGQTWILLSHFILDYWKSKLEGCVKHLDISIFTNEK